MHPDELLKAKQDAQAQWEKENVLNKAQVGPGIGGLAGGAVTPHPRETLLNDINDQEQRLLDKLVAIREIKREYMFLSRDEAERIVKLSRLAEQLMR